MRRSFISYESFVLVAVLTAITSAATPTTRPSPPSTPVGPRERPTVIDSSKPAFVPKFVQANRVPAGQFEERDYARRFGSPAGVGYGYGYWGPIGWWGYGFVGGYGPASANVSVNYR